MDLSSYLQCAGASPPSAPVAPSVGYPSGGDPATGSPATTPGPYWFYQLQQEITHLLVAAGLTPSTSNLSQVHEAVIQLASGGLSFESLTAQIKMDGAVAVGVRNTVARGDHVHPTDTSRAPLLSPDFTGGTPLVPTQTAGNNSTRAASTAFVAAAIAGVPAGSVPAATIIGYGGQGSPAGGYLKCDGSNVSSVIYSALWAALGTTWGAGSSTTTTKLPDLRGRFARFFDDGAGLDAGRAMGTYQKGTLVVWDMGTLSYATRTLNTGTVYGAAAQALVGADAYSLSSSYVGLRTVYSVPATLVTTTSADQLGNAADMFTGVTRPPNATLAAWIKY